MGNLRRVKKMLVVAKDREWKEGIAIRDRKGRVRGYYDQSKLRRMKLTLE